jgi:hypothetical protein
VEISNPKHELFAQALIKHKGHQTEAYMEVYPKSKYDSARHSAAVLLRNAYIRERIRELLDTHGLGVTKLLKKLKELTEAYKTVRIFPNLSQDMPVHGVQLEALRLAFYLHGFWKKQQIELNLSPEQMTQIAQMAKDFEKKQDNSGAS